MRFPCRHAAGHKPCKDPRSAAPVPVRSVQERADDARAGEYPEDKHGCHMDPEEFGKFNDIMIRFEGYSGYRFSSMPTILYYGHQG